jgi:hypothetical protein
MAFNTNNFQFSTDDFSQGGPMSNTPASRWPDLYALLNVPQNADEDTLRVRIREAYLEATANSDHRNMERRIHFQTMAERIVPQCRRILLDAQLRSEYDMQLELHRKNAPSALDYTEFLRGVPGSGVVSSAKITLPGKQGDNTSAHASAVAGAPADDGNAAWAGIPALAGSETEAPARPTTNTAGFAEEEEKNPSPLASVSIPAVTFSPETMPELITESTPAPTGRPSHASSTSPSRVRPTDIRTADQSPIHQPAAQTEEVRRTTAPATPAPTSEAWEETAAAKPSPVASKPETAEPTPAEAEQDEDTIRAATLPADVAAAIFDPDGNASTPDMLRGGRIRQQTTRKTLRVRGGGATTTISANGGGKRLLSQRTQMLLTAIAAAGLTIFIMRTNGGAQRLPLRVAYASGLQSFMEASKQRFEGTPDGAVIELQMQPIDSRAGMQAALSQRPFADLWIPSESLWSDRFNEVAGSKKVQSIASARSFALSPYVLLARSDRAATLRRQFPNRIIPSWSALRSAVNAGAPGHFGLSDPVKSGSGAIVRYFMAREWCERNGVTWAPEAARNKGLSAWMNSFEENIPVSAKLSADMVKDLALGTGSRYWWAIALESEGVGWMKAGKPLEVFYLPQTNYADYPLCFLSPSDADDQINAARAVFDAYLRSVPTQQALLQSGYRPTGIELKTNVAGNPFNDAKMKERGLRSEGFKVVERINYRILNALSAAWSARWE